jgi:transposase
MEVERAFSSKVMERTHGEATEGLFAGRETRHLRRHLLDKEPISKLCDDLGLQPTVFYRWQKEFFENGAAAFESSRSGDAKARQLEQHVEKLQAKIIRKDEVIAEVMEEAMRLKKSLGEI